MNIEPITIRAVVRASLSDVWKYWNEPEYITRWAFASDDWEAPRAHNDLRVGGTFTTRMQAKDGSEGFDFSGTYTNVKEHEHIEYTMDDGRRVKNEFTEMPEGVEITTTFDPESEHSREMQEKGWQAILDSFKKFVQSR